MQQFMVRVAWTAGSARGSISRSGAARQRLVLRVGEASQRWVDSARRQAIRACLALADYLQSTHIRFATPVLDAHFPVAHVPGTRGASAILPHAPIPPAVSPIEQTLVSRFGNSPAPLVDPSLLVSMPNWNPVYELSDDEFDDLDDEPTTVYNPIPTPFDKARAQHHHLR